MKRFFYGLLAAFLMIPPCAELFAQDRGAQLVAAENLGAQANIGKQYALFIAIDAYRSWPPLKKPVSDAKKIRDILNRDYYIDEVVELYDGQAKKADIIRTFTNLQAKLGVHDSLFIYYAGHGHLDEGSDAGFWIPVDGGTDREAQENWLPNSQIRGFISRFKTIHVFMVSDSCFAGDIIRLHRGPLPQIDNAYFRNAYKLTSRQVLTSGSLESVPDQSEFSAALINCLQKNTSPLLDPHSIFADVRLAVSETRPLYGELTGASHQEGATFLFFRKQAAQSAQPVAPSPPQATAPLPQQPTVTGGSVTVNSEIAGEIFIDGQATGRRIKAGGTETISNVSTGNTEVWVKDSNGATIKAPTVMVVQGQTVSATIKALAQPQPTTPTPTPAPAPAQQPAAPPQRPVPANMVRIQGGTFTMGSPANEVDRDDDEIQRQVTVSSFYMGKYEVTQKEYQEIMGTNPSIFKGDNLPVENIRWYEAIEYCNKRSQKEGLTPAYSISGTGDNRTVTWNKNANGYRLPTEAEWEYACRAGTTTPFNTGNNITTRNANYDGNNPYNNNAKGEYRQKTTPVGSFAPNAWGLYDMHGNVWEWCWDWYGAYSSGAQTDPVGASSESGRVYRGGSWGSYADLVRSAYRSSNAPSYRYDSLGFRLVRP
jgi:formylglycine-generating enzyme required for sulfatase activity